MDIWKGLEKGAIGLGIIAVVIVMFQLLLNGMTTTGQTSNASNTTVTTSISALGQIPNYFGLIVLVIIIAFLIGFLISKLKGIGGNKYD